MNWANPLTMRHEIDDPSVQEFKTSFLTTSLITLLSLRCGSLEGIESGSVGMQWVQRAGLIPLRSWSE